MIALKVACFLVLDEDCVVVKVTVTVPAPSFGIQDPWFVEDNTIRTISRQSTVINIQGGCHGGTLLLGHRLTRNVKGGRGES